MNSSCWVETTIVWMRSGQWVCRTQIGHHLPLAADDGQLLEDDVRQDVCGGHILARLVAGVSEHDTLVAGPLLLLRFTDDALVNVGRLFVDGRENAARIAVELVFAAGVADAVDDPARHALYVDIGIGTHFTGHNDQSCGTECFAGYFRV